MDCVMSRYGRPTANYYGEFVSKLTRKCCNCGEIKHENEFYISSRYEDGMYKNCRECRSKIKLKKKRILGNRCSKCGKIILKTSKLCVGCFIAERSLKYKLNKLKNKNKKKNQK